MRNGSPITAQWKPLDLFCPKQASGSSEAVVRLSLSSLPSPKVSVNPGEDAAGPSPFPGSVSDLMEVACGSWLPPVPADPGTGPPRVHILLTGSRLHGAALWFGWWSTGLCSSAGNSHVKPTSVGKTEQGLKRFWS